MALFSKKSGKKESESKKTAISAEKEGKVAITGKSGRIISAKSLLRPRITEKAHLVSGKNQYVFEVHPRANKQDVRKAAQELYGIQVENVTSVKGKPKKKRYGRNVGFTKGTKKVYITVKEGDTIDLFKG